MSDIIAVLTDNQYLPILYLSYTFTYPFKDLNKTDYIAAILYLRLRPHNPSMHHYHMTKTLET